MTASTSSTQTALPGSTNSPDRSTENSSDSRLPEYDFYNTYPEAWEEAFQYAEALSQHNESSPNNVSTLTDIASLAWCEQQFDYSLASGGRAETQAMTTGRDIHFQLELEVHNIVNVDVASIEDAWGVRLHNLIEGLQTLRLTGKTRELPIFGFVDEFFVVGIIDEIVGRQKSKASRPESTGQNKRRRSLRTRRNDNWHQLEKDDGYSWYLSDTKTRTRPYIPSASNVQPSVRIQLMLYKKLFDDMIAGHVDEDLMYEKLAVDPDASLSDGIVGLVGDVSSDEEYRDDGDSDHYVVESHDSGVTLRELMKAVRKEFRHFNKLNDELEISYRYQEDGSNLGSVFLTYDEVKLDRDLRRACEYWKGTRKPEGVDIEEAWKCG
ncbi:10535_t:CDS:2 [Paraglomus occultum]|uniref:10535_t:CDS:1 n=1 Tax=Paraglomus occultum TaxID=144539 RepID=A0A9N9G1Q9_9GLOM|nr:10535_t:CDS:2 [Paraglomus occultum]